MLVLQYIGGKRAARRVYHALVETVENGQKAILKTACGLSLPRKSYKTLSIRSDDYERCPMCNQVRFKGYRRN